MRGASLAVGLALAALLGAAPAAAAADSKEEAFDPKKEAGLLLRAGNDAYVKGNYDDALKLFQRAFDTFPSAKLYYNMALCETQLGRKLDAANHFLLFDEKVGDDPAIAKERAAAAAQVAQAATHYGLLRFSAQPADARFEVDGTLVAGAAMFVKPGKHTVVASAVGRSTQLQKVEVGAGQERSVVVALREAPAGKPEEQPKVEVLPHEDKHEGNEPRADEWVESSAASGAPVVPFSLVGGGGVLLGASALFGILASRHQSELGSYIAGEVPGTTDGQVAAERSAIRRDAWISTGLLGAGLAAGAVGGVLLVLHYRGNSEPPPALVTLGPSGVAVAGRF